MLTIYTVDIAPASAARTEVDTALDVATIGDQLRGLRIAAGLTQTALAARIGMSQPTVSAVENGTPTTTDVLERWIAACRGVFRVEHAGTSPLGSALQAIAALDDEQDFARIEKIARAMPGVPVETKEGIARALAAISPSR